MNTEPLCTPSDSPLEDLWISELLSKSAPMTTTNSFTDALNFEMSHFEDYPVNNNTNNDFSDLLENNDSIFSGSLRSLTVSSTPPIKEEEEDELTKFGNSRLLDGVSAKLHMMQRSNDLTPRALESIFNTKDVLKDSEDTQAGLDSGDSKYHPNPCVEKKRASRRKLTNTQKEAHNKVEKKYRVNINTKIASLQTIIPWFADDKDLCMDMKVNKSTVLEKAYEYIQYLKKENAGLKDRLG